MSGNDTRWMTNTSALFLGNGPVSTDPTVSFFWWLLGTHVALWTLLPLWMGSVTAPGPSEEGFAWGYATQAPLSAWVTQAATSMTGRLAGIPILISQLCNAVSIWVTWSLARRYLHPWTALCVATAVCGGFVATLLATGLSGSQLAGCFWSLAVFSLHEALTHPRRRDWILLGVWLGLGLLSSYATALLIIVIVAFTIWDSQARKCWDSSWPFLALLSMSAIILLHVIWLMQNEFITVKNVFAAPAAFNGQIVTPLIFLSMQLLSTVPLIFLIWPLVRPLDEETEEDRLPEWDETQQFVKRLLLWLVSLPPAGLVALQFLTGPTSMQVAGAGVWSLLPLTIALSLKLVETRAAWRQTILRTGATLGFLAALLIVMQVMWPRMEQDLAQKVTKARIMSRGE